MTTQTKVPRSKTWMTASGYSVTPVKGSFRRASGGYCVDVRSDDDRCTVSYWTENADNVRDERLQPYREH
jgi:hypothetical protein